MDNFIRDTLKKQMQILSERSGRENGEYLAPITAQMIELAKLLDPELMIAAEKTRVSKAYEQFCNEEEFRKEPAQVAILQDLMKATYDRENRGKNGISIS